MDSKLRELTALSLLSLGGLCLAWVKNADYFALTLPWRLRQASRRFFVLDDRCG
jgi:hypothetical protein